MALPLGNSLFREAQPIGLEGSTDLNRTIVSVTYRDAFSLKEAPFVTVLLFSCFFLRGSEHPVDSHSSSQADTSL